MKCTEPTFVHKEFSLLLNLTITLNSQKTILNGHTNILCFDTRDRETDHYVITLLEYI